MKSYIGTKIIQAYPMSKSQWNTFRNQESAQEDMGIDGYKVMYPDGYISWSPKEQFEQAYRLISDGEKDLIR